MRARIVRLRAKAAETLGLVVHELAINALKYGALATPEGHIHNHVAPGGGSRLPVRAPRMDGRRLPPDSSALALHRGFGRDLIERTVPYELRGSTRLLFEPASVRCIIDIPTHAGPSWSSTLQSLI